LENTLKKQLKATAIKARLAALEGVWRAKSGHPGGSLSAADLLTYLYFKQMKLDPKNPGWEERDRFVLSKGHAAPGLYAVLALRGYFPVEDLATLRHPDSHLQGHPNMHLTPGVDMSTGSLGQGISAAVGMALGAKIGGKAWRTYAMLGDGELQEGQVWEAAMFAAAKGLDNLTIVVDNNNLQIDGTIEQVNSPYPIAEKFAAFGWHVIEINGHCFGEIEKAFDEALTISGKPVCIVAKTIKGKGVSFMENNVGWHGSAPNDEQYEQAVAELKAALAEVEG
jgi:transketolase